MSRVPYEIMSGAIFTLLAAPLRYETWYAAHTVRTTVKRLIGYNTFMHFSKRLSTQVRGMGEILYCVPRM